MKKEDIKKAAQEYEDDMQYRFDDMYSTCKAFIAGAQWRVRSVWHDVEMQPEDGRLTLLEYGEGFNLIGGPQYWEWEDTVKQLDIKRWAYVEDLIP